MRRAAARAIHFARDRLVRTAALAAGSLAVFLPRVAGAGRSGPAAAGFRDGLAAGGAGGTMAGLWGVLLLAGVALLWQGLVSAETGSGRFRTVLSRPGWRPGLYVARHGAAVLLLGAGIGGAAGALALAGGGVGDPTGVLLAALLTGWTLGGLVFLLSSLLDRGDVLAAVALFLAPGALDGLGRSPRPVAAAADLLSAALPPMLPLRDARHLLVAGEAPVGGDLLVCLTYGAAAVGLAVLRLQSREYGGV